MAAEAHAPTASEYIVHHLTHLNSSGGAQKNIIDFAIVNWDTVFWSVITAVLAGWLMHRAARLITTGAPNRFVGAIESVVEFVHEQARAIVHGDLTYVAPLALVSFVWIFLMNAIDLIPVDLFPRIAEVFGIHYMRAVPTADINGTISLSTVVIASSLYYGVKVKGASGFLRELFTAPFGSHFLLWPINFAMQLIEYLARLVSLGMRLFGNMYAGELVFMLIALLGATVTWWGTGLHFLTGLAWAIFHILIITLQAFIFMMLALVYVGQGFEKH
ncbi:MAG: F0F1 ATP synthase subunit A [Burkholderiaceae bacterium]|nr:F0F1 ATP synthase subunit A [Burkholderiaceae bacterium]MCD6673733.1 F0F1 ATP synthase subunit A [Burkholderiaceae bacterium]